MLTQNKTHPPAVLSPSEQEETISPTAQQTPEPDSPEHTSLAIPIPCPPPNPSASAISNTTPALYNGPFHRLEGHDTLIP